MKPEASEGIPSLDYVGKLCPRCNSPNSVPSRESNASVSTRECSMCRHVYNVEEQPYKDIRTLKEVVIDGVIHKRKRKKDNRQNQRIFEGMEAYENKPKNGGTR